MLIFEGRTLADEYDIHAGTVPGYEFTVDATANRTVGQCNLEGDRGQYERENECDAYLSMNRTL